ncbi:cell divisionFtsK/SpoIIIE [Leptothrix cholodnii SP-6]|uniref:Cell divisionFtsK/SpoIIIE n=1 Tax=Leptothrix cholodnii (strain ATCC 51168 / LMG 8142 / SP-6) TaxID=395495 RepID=B1Y152_LEPCP|nr:DNA translocase FtsK [Leptothrix cholodnii]ACB33029.1 cell divisionFtsK/SpoIIIE [Leptothrix cholodnii SP-6]
MTYPLGSLRSAASAEAAGAPTPPLPARPVPRWKLQIGIALGATIWLLWLMALLSHHPGDWAFSTSGDGEPLRNRVGALGAWWSDLSYVTLGLSVWWCLLFMLRGWLALVAQSLRLDSPSDPEGAMVWRPQWLAWLGLLLLLMASCALEWTRLYRFEAGLAGSHAGGMLGATLGPVSMKWLGFAGSGVAWIVVLLIGLSWAFRFSWVVMAERIGAAVEGLRERRVERLERAEDERIGQRAQRERERGVEVERVAEAERHIAEHQLPVLVELPTLTETALAPGLPAAPAMPAAPAVTERQKPLFVELENTRLPQVDLLDAAPATRVETVTPESIEMTSRLIEKKLKDFGVEVRVVMAQPGPVITRYEIEPAVGVKGSQVVNLAKDLARSLSLVSIRVVEIIPGKTTMALELPNARRLTIRLAEILGSQVYDDATSQLTIGLGKDIVGAPVVADLAKMPHVLVAGTTGSGKSVGINAMILSLLYKAEARDVRLILIDPKMLEMSVYEGIPHLLAPVVTDMKQAGNALNWCVAEMERRYKLLSKMGVRNLAGYNKKIAEATAHGELIPNPFSLTPEAPEPLDRLPQIVVVIDELADLMMVVGKKIEELIARLAQKARASGIHLILATQRPSVDVITGLIKANIPTRISFQVSSKIDSRTILDQMGAEALLGQGDMLYLSPGTGLPVRVHGAFVSDDEVHRVVSYLKTQGEPNYIEGILEGGVLDGEGGDGAEGGAGAAGGEADPMYDQAVAVVLQHRRASISLVQRHLRIGYNRAARLLEQMEQSGLVSSMATNGNRDILVPPRPTE